MGTISLSDYEDVQIRAPWGNIAGRWYGNRSERPILAIHGWLDNLGTFDTLIPLLPDYLGVLCIDLPGHGHSAPLSPGMHYSVEQWVLTIAIVMKELKWTHVSLMGHSLGGILSYFFTALAPHLVDFVIALDCFLPLLESKHKVKKISHSIEKYFEEEDRAREALAYEPVSRTKEQLANVLAKVTYNSVQPEFAEYFLKRNTIKSEQYPDRYYSSTDGRTKVIYMSMIPMPLARELANRLKSNPILIIKAMTSPFIYPESREILQILAEENPNYEFYEVSGMHHVHLTNPQVCAQYIIPFIERHRPRAMSGDMLSDERALTSKQQSKL